MHPIEGENAALPVFVQLLGVPSVTLGDQTLKFRYRRAEALLYLLVVERRRMSRSRVAQLLWPSADAKSATRSLSVVLNDVRAKIGDRLVAPSDSPYVSLQRVRSDVDRIESLATLPLNALASDTLLTRSVPLLEGFHLPDSGDFEEWRRHADDQLQERLASERGKRIEQALHEDAADVAFALLDASVQRDPWDERLLMRFVRLALRRGDAGLALRRVRSSIDAIRAELEIEPSPEIQALMRALTLMRTNPSTSLTQLVGHLKVQEDVETWVLDGTDDVLVLVGAPGIGATTFARSVLLANPLLHDSVIHVADVHDADADVFTERMRNVLEEVKAAHQRPIVLVDGLGQTPRLHELARTVAEKTKNVRWVFTAQQAIGVTGERVLNLDPLRVPTAATLGLQREVPSIDLFLRVSHEQAPGRAFERPEEATLTRLLRRTGGHPIAITALAKIAASTSDASTLDLHDVWKANAPEVHALREAMAPRLEAISEGARSTATTLALFESGAHLDELHRCIGGNQTTIERNLQELKRAGWVVEDATPRRVHHQVAPWAIAALHAEAARLPDANDVGACFAACILDRMRPLSKELHGARQREVVEEGLVVLGDVVTTTDLLAQTDPPAAIALAAASWPLFRRAGRAAELLTRIEPLTLQHANRLEGSERADALATLANLMILNGRMGEARPLHEEALSIRDSLGELHQSAQSRLNLAQVLATVGELDAAATMLEEGARVAQEADAMWLYGACLGNWGHVLHDLGQLEEAVRVYDEALRVLEPIGDTLSIIGIRIAQLSVYAHLGQGEWVVRVIHLLEPKMQHVPFGTARSLARPMRVAIDELAHAGWLHAAERLERSAYDHGFIVD